jgi:hypothetical protein
LIINKKATIWEMVKWVKISEKMIRWYLNQFINDYWIVSRDSDKLRDKNAVFKLIK